MTTIMEVGEAQLLEKRTVTLSDIRETITIYMEAIGKVPFEIFEETGNWGPAMLETNKQTGVVNVQLPPKINTFKEREENKEAYMAIGAIHAARYRYGQGFNPETLYEIVRRESEKARKIDPKSPPIRKSENWNRKITFIEGGRVVTVPEDTLLHYTEHETLVRKIIEITEAGRIARNMYEEFQGARDLTIRNIPYFYEEELETQAIPEGTRPVRKEDVFETAIIRLRYELMLGSENFDEEYKQAKPGRERSERAREIDEKAKIITQKFRTIIAPALTPESTLHTSIECALELYLHIIEGIKNKQYPNMGSNWIPESNYGCVTEEKEKTSDPIERQKEENARLQKRINRTIIQNFESTTSASRFRREQDRHYSEGTIEAFQTRNRLSIEGTPTYHEWDYTIKKFRKRWTHVRTLKNVPEPRKKTYPYPETDKKKAEQVQAQIENEIPARKMIIEGQTRGEFDEEAYAQYHAKQKTGEPALPDFYTEEEIRERSVATLIIADISQSTGKLVSKQYTILDKIKEAVHYITRAAQKIEDPIAIYAASSAPRYFTDDHYRKDPAYKDIWNLEERTTTFYQIKEWEEEITEQEIRERLTKIEPQKNNRDGAIIRHGTTMLTERDEKIKRLVYINDGAPEDKRLKEPTPEELQTIITRPHLRTQIEPEYKERHAWEDTIMAIQEATGQGITPLIIRIGTSKDIPRELVQRTGGQIRTVTQDLNNLVTVITEAYTQIGM